MFRIAAPDPYLLHLELEANPRTGIPADLLRYNTLLDHQHGLPVETVLVLLRRKALASDMTGEHVRRGVTGRPITTFRYHVERVWERPAGFWLAGGVGLAPLALLTDEADRNQEAALTAFRDHLRAGGTDTATERSLVGSAYFLSGLRYNDQRIADLFRSLNMLLEDSTTYQATIRKGISQGLAQGLAQGGRQVILRMGAKKFGPPGEATVVALQAITDPARLEQLAERLLEVNTWDDLLATP